MYSDEDGTATRESQAAYDTRIQILLSITAILTWMGYAASIPNENFLRDFIHSYVPSLEPSDVVGWSKSNQYLWFFLLVRSVSLFSRDGPVKTYTAGLRGSLFSILITCFILFARHSNGYNHFSVWSLTSFQLCASFILAIIQVLFPRRPNLFTAEGKAVDAERSSSAFSKYTMKWCTSALSLAGKPVTLDELPVLDYLTRSRNQPLLVLTSLKTTLWDRILADRYLGFAKQWSLMLLRSLITFGSPYCVMKLLKSLEDNHGGTEHAWLWLIGIGVFSVWQTIINYHLIWIQWSEMGIPVRAQLIMSIFQKALRRKDSKDQTKVSDSKDVSYKPEVINLISSDTLSFSKFTAVNYIIPSSFVRFFFAVLFLFRLLGWQSTLVGLIATIICVPVHTFVIQKQRVAGKTLTAARDRKIKVVSEALYALRQIKFSALEAQWEEHIKSFRQEEIVLLHRFFYATNIKSIWGVAAPFIVAAASISIYAYLQGAIMPSVIFPMINVLPHLQETLGFVPVVFLDYFGARSNSKRMEEYLRRPEQDRILGPSPSGNVIFREAAISWPSDSKEDGASEEKPSPQPFSLQGINLEFPVGELSVISGKTGSGKSLLLAAIIGEVDLLDGNINAPSAADGHPVAFVSQTPWLQNGSIKENVLFGNPFDKDRYEKVLTACALRPDLRVLSKGDETQIGLRGVKLSGGQRARLSFARALYSSAQLMVLDDIFSALDSHVSKEIFDALTGELSEGRTRILVTHQVPLCLPKAKYVVRIENNTIGYAGNTNYTEKVVEILGVKEREDSKPEKEGNEKRNDAEKLPKSRSAGNQVTKTNARADLKVYKSYFTAAGGSVFATVYLSGLVAKQLLSALTTWLLGRIRSGRPKASLYDYEENGGFRRYLYLYLSSSLLAIVMESVFNLHAFSGSIRASETLFRQMTSKILRMPLLWLDTTSIGGMLKSFTVDIRLVDDSALVTMSEFTDCLVKLLVIIGVGIYTSIYTSLLTILLLIWCAITSRAYIKARSTIKRADAGPTADILEHLTSITTGVSTIRAFGAAERSVDKMHGYLDKLSTARRHFWIFNRWLGLQMSFIGIAFSTGTGIILMWSKSIVDPSLIGFSLTFSMGFSQAIFKAVNSFGILETYMNATSSVISFTELETEDQSGTDVPEEWPSHGLVEVKDLCISYSPDLPLVLKNVSFTVPAGQRIGIVGRTGAGKSSLTLSFLRLLQPRSGSISIDNIDISTIKLRSLRSRIAFIPQDPVLFSGTIRSNLDYFNLLPEAKLHSALQRVGLLAPSSADEKNSSKFLFTLDSPISSGGSNISQGQRQLLCLARVLLQSPKIIILDEATSAVDNATDLLIQETIRNEFKGTLIAVAHRLRTVKDFDLILVMGEGEVREMGSPKELLGKEGGLFWELVRGSQDWEGFMEGGF